MLWSSAVISLLLGAASSAVVPNVKLNNGVMMPLMSMGTWQFNVSTAETVVKQALTAGFTHIDAAYNYNNQEGTGKALVGVARNSYFLTTKVPPVKDAATAYSQTKQLLQDDLTQLGLEHVDLMLLHGPPQDCKAIQEQWRAIEEFYAAGKAKAIGVSNFCMSSFACINQTAKVVPAVNQIQFHVGMGPDPEALVSYHRSHGIVTQAYSPLGDGTLELITGKLVTGIGKAHGMSGAQVSMRWIIEKGAAFSTKTTKISHMQQDLGIFGFALTSSEIATLDQATTPASKPSWACTSSVLV